MTTQCCYGFRVVGPATCERRLVDAGNAFAAYAACDARAELEREAYLSAFQFADDFRQYFDDAGTVRGFDGVCWSPWIWFDLDRPHLDAALADARRLASFIADRYRLDGDAQLIFFSGSKGFHVGLPTALWGLEPSTTFHRVARRFAEGVAQAAGVAIDAGVYDKVRLFRAPNSRHQKTGRYKRRLAFDELLGLSLDAILGMAEKPAPFDVPAPDGRCEQAAADWSAAMESVRQQAEAKAHRRADGIQKLNRSALAFIRDGAEQGDRHRLLFSAAANLAEFGCSPALAHALLTEPGLDAGLSPSDVRRQIDCGLAHVGNGPPPDIITPSPAATTPEPAPDLTVQLAAQWARSAVPTNAGDAWESPGYVATDADLLFPPAPENAGPYTEGA